MTAPRWTVYGVPVICGSGYGPHEIPAGDPVRMIGPLVRCELHASTPVDVEAVAAARRELEARREARAVQPVIPAMVRRMPRAPRPVTPFTKLADVLDPKMLAAGERDLP